MKTPFEPQTDLKAISDFANQHQAENDRFSAFLKEFNDEAIDAKVQELDALISPTISCTDCGNCCKNLISISLGDCDNTSLPLSVILKNDLRVSSNNPAFFK